MTTRHVVISAHIWQCALYKCTLEVFWWGQLLVRHLRIQGGAGTGGPDPPEISQNIRFLGFLERLIRIPWKITKLLSQHSIMGHHWHVSETVVGLWWPKISCIWIHSSTKKKITLSKLALLWKNFLDPRMSVSETPFRRSSAGETMVVQRCILAG